MVAVVATILVVDDEPRIVQVVRDYLQHGGFAVLVASDGPSALRTARTGRPDLIVLDLGLPGQDGLDVARALRRDGDVPIIMLTARSDESDKLVGLELGADDYITKPFSPKELVARIRTVLRRAEGMKEPAEVIRVGIDVELDVATDPFFGRSGRMLAASQREQALKFEVSFQIAGPEPTALASFNYHGEHFASVYGIRLAGGELAHTACLGFGLERIALALFRTHGMDRDGWPAEVLGELALT